MLKKSIKNPPSYCQDKPLQKEKKQFLDGDNIKETDILQIFGLPVNKASATATQTINQQQQLKQTQQMQQSLDKQLMVNSYQLTQKTIQSNNLLSVVGDMKNVGDLFQNFEQNIQQIEDRKQKRVLDPNEINNKKKRQTNQEEAQQLNDNDNTKRIPRDNYTIFDGKITVYLDADNIQSAQDYLKELDEKIEIKKNEKIDSKQVTYSDLKKSKGQSNFPQASQIMYELRMDPYRGKELMKYLKNKKYEENVNSEIMESKYKMTPWHFDKKYKQLSKKLYKNISDTPPPKIPEQTQQEFDERKKLLETYKKKKLIQKEKAKGLFIIQKKEFDTNQSISPNVQSQQKLPMAPIMKRTMFYEEKEGQTSEQFTKEQMQEIDFLYFKFQKCGPQSRELLDINGNHIQLNFYKDVERGQVINFILQDPDLKQFYGIQDQSEAKRRFKQIKTLHPKLVNFKEFVQLLYFDKKSLNFPSQNIFQQRIQELDISDQLYYKDEPTTNKNNGQSQKSIDFGDPERKPSSSFRINSQNSSSSLNQVRSEKPETKPLSLSLEKKKFPITVPLNLFDEKFKKQQPKSQDIINASYDESLNKSFRLRVKSMPKSFSDRQIFKKMMEEYKEKQSRTKEELETIQQALLKPFKFQDKVDNYWENRKNQLQQKQVEISKEYPQENFSAKPIPKSIKQKKMEIIIEKQKQKLEAKMKMQQELLDAVQKNNTQKQVEEEKAIQQKIQQICSFQPFDESKRREVPDFNKLHKKFDNSLIQKKQKRPSTAQKPFNFSQSLNKKSNYNYMDIENELQRSLRERVQLRETQQLEQDQLYKEVVMPSSTQKMIDIQKLRQKQKKEKEQKLQQEIQLEQQKKDKIQDIKKKVQTSIYDNSAEKEEAQKEKKQQFLEDLKQKKQFYEKQKQEIQEKVNNQPLLFQRESTKGKQFINESQEYQKQQNWKYWKR